MLAGWWERFLPEGGKIRLPGEMGFPKQPAQALPGTIPAQAWMMSVLFRIYATTESCPALDDLIEVLEESDFEITLESELDEDEDGVWEDVLVWDANLEEPLSVIRLTDVEEVRTDSVQLLEQLGLGPNHCKEREFLERALKNCAGAFTVEVPETLADEDNALLLASQLAQFLSQRTDGFYTVDSEGIFDDSGDLLLELVEGEQ